MEHVVILKSKFDLEDRRVFFGRARLLPDRIILTGLGFKQIIRLNEIEEIRWSSDLLMIGLTDGSEVDMIIESAALWKFELQSRCNLKDVRIEGDLSGPLPESIEETGDGVSTDQDASLVQRESTYKMRSLFAEDRPGFKRD